MSGQYTQTCQYIPGVWSIYCPGLHNSAFPTGTQTLTYSAASGFVPFIPTSFIVGNPESAKTQLQTITVTSTTQQPRSTRTVIVPLTTRTTTKINIAFTLVNVHNTTTIGECNTSSLMSTGTVQTTEEIPPTPSALASRRSSLAARYGKPDQVSQRSNFADQSVCNGCCWGWGGPDSTLAQLPPEKASVTSTVWVIVPKVSRPVLTPTASQLHHAHGA